MSEKKPLPSYKARLAVGSVTIETLYRERDALLDLYKHHLKLVLEANVFIYAVTGAIASFASTHTTMPHIRFILLLPASVCAFFAIFFFIVSAGFKYTQSDLDVISEGLDTNTSPLIHALPIGLWLSAILLLLTTLGLVLAFHYFSTAVSVMGRCVSSVWLPALWLS